MRRYHPAIVAATFAAAVVIGAAIGPSLSGAQQPPVMAPPPEPASSDPLELFSVMMPVFTHPRCANCHGAVDPHAESGPLEDTHDGGVVPAGGTCADPGCHTQTDDNHEETRWQTASPFHNFNGRTAKQLCDMQSGVADDLNARRPEGYFQHLNTDFLIDLAFVGQSGGANNSADPPRMGKDDFLKAARAWLDVGAKCNTWTGSITQHETFASRYSHPFPVEGGPITISVTEQAQRIVTIDRANGESTFRINQGGHQTMTSVTREAGCEVTLHSNINWTGQNQAPVRGKVTVRIRPDGSYTIRFVGPEEKTVTQESGHASATCPMPLPGATADTTVLEWVPWSMNINCPGNFTQDPATGNTIDCDLFDPRHPRLKGTMKRTIKDHTDASDRQTWLSVSPVGISRSDDGSSIPVTIVTTWDLTLPP